MSDTQRRDTLERKRKLDEQLSKIISKDWNDLVNKSNEYISQIQQSTLSFYQDQLEKELDEMENAIRERNIERAMYHRAAAENYLRLLNWF